MKNIGCCKNLEDSNKEQRLLEEIWQSLSFRIATKISVGDFKLFLMAILSIKGNRRMGLQQEEHEDYQIPYGWINDEGQLCLSNQHMSKIQSKFAILHMNRMNHKGDVIAEKKLQNEIKSIPSFKPNLEKKILTV